MKNDNGIECIYIEQDIAARLWIQIGTYDIAFSSKKVTYMDFGILPSVHLSSVNLQLASDNCSLVDVHLLPFCWICYQRFFFLSRVIVHIGLNSIFKLFMNACLVKMKKRQKGSCYSIEKFVVVLLHVLKPLSKSILSGHLRTTWWWEFPRGLRRDSN